MDKYIGASVQLIINGEFVQVAVQAATEAVLAEAVERIEAVSDTNNTGSK
jgi:hypothetical protein